MKRLIVSTGLFLLLLTSCVKWPFSKEDAPSATIEDVTMYDSLGKAIKDFYAGRLIRLVSDKFIALNQAGDLVKEGFIQFDTIKVPILKAEKNYILTRVPIMLYTLSINVSINLLIGNQLLRLCPRCNFTYRPTVRGQILAGYAKGMPDGTFREPAEMTLDGDGNIYVIDQDASHDVILKVTPAGAVTPFAGSGGEFGRLVGIGLDRSRNCLYVADATVQRILKIDIGAPATINVLAGSGMPGNTDGTGTAASFKFGSERAYQPGGNDKGQGLALDATGNIYVGEVYRTDPNASQIRKITPEGIVSTLPGSRTSPTGDAEVRIPAGLTVSSTNDLFYVSGFSGVFQGITRIAPDGTRSSLAGLVHAESLNDGTGAVAQFSYPKAIASYGTYLYVADGSNGALRRINNSSGQVITLAGVGHRNTNSQCAGGCPPGGLPPVEGSYWMPVSVALVGPDYFEEAARAIRMDIVGGVAARNDGLIYVSDDGYRCIWKITVY
ncbi:hypothetical protein HB364_12830 [Pseudoflavitalea sp. X16]|uniref:hypothetical protein n=1 Tax=Paraflavitalea devenefica TaxID=2716334 RepID=UPI0014231995|nr:hypothetical protein [Paraflavitalea devenefica]NII25972.1 hypothetical protein [Paraflavitalea devenefica]